MGVEEAEEEFVKEGGEEVKGSGCFCPLPRGAYLTLCVLSSRREDEEGRKGREEEVATNTHFSI